MYIIHEKQPEDKIRKPVLIGHRYRADTHKGKSMALRRTGLQNMEEQESKIMWRISKWETSKIY